MIDVSELVEEKVEETTKEVEEKVEETTKEVTELQGERNWKSID